MKRKPGHSDVDRSLGSTDQKYKKLKTVDSSQSNQEVTKQMTSIHVDV